MSSDETPANIYRADTPHPIHPSERALVQWVATASPGDDLPDTWRYAMNPYESVLRTLAKHGVVPMPAPPFDAEAVVGESGAAAAAWIEQHPAPEPPA